MVDSLRSLLDGVIDYSGLFPPADLSMAVALQTYLKNSRAQDGWILGRFACPADRLHELQDLILSRAAPSDLALTVVGGSNSGLDDWEELLETDATTMNDFVEACEEARVESYEVRLPSNEGAETYAYDLRAFSDVEVFVELPWGPGMDDALAAIAQTEWLMVKVRTGADSTGRYPSTKELAGFLHGAIALDLGIKLAGGLRHVLPRTEPDGSKCHGLLNVLTATGLALTEDMTKSEIEKVLESASIRDWKFSQNKLTWRDAPLGLDDIEDARNSLLAVGSCVVEETLAELDALGLLAGEN